MRKKTVALAAAITAGLALCAFAGTRVLSSGLSASDLSGVDWSNADPARMAPIEKELPRNAALRQALIGEFRKATEMGSKAIMAQLLVSSARDEMFKQAALWVRSADAGERADGFALWMAFPPTPEAYAAALQAIDTEQDEKALTFALLALRPEILPSRQAAQSVVPKLVRLTAHDAPLVRAHALQQLAEWDKTTAVSGPLVAKALGDRDTSVRQAAIGAVMIGSIRSDEVKGLLIDLLANEQEDLRLRASAINAIEHFSLAQPEHQRYVAARVRVGELLSARHAG